MTKLTREQIAEIKSYLEGGKDLPHDYRDILFPPDRVEYELVYRGKERVEDILAGTWNVPLQPVRTFNLAKGQPVPEWTNRLIFGDNLQIMRRLLDDPQIKGQVKLVYIDPPFATKQDFQGAEEQKAYQDKVAGAEFLEFLRKRLVIIRELLSSSGFLVLHIDYRYGHYLKVLLDELFGGGFRNEITVPRGTKNVQNQFEEISALTTGDDSLFLYAKSNTAKLPHLRIDLGEQAAGKWDTFWRGTDRPTMRYRLFGHKPDKGQWRWKESRALEAKSNYARYQQEFASTMTLDEYYLRELDRGADLDFVRKNDEGVVQYYVPPRDSRVANTIWTDVRTIGRVTSYPTEKHEDLLFRLVEWLTKPHDLVLDSFAGSGTTSAVAEKTSRRWIAIDCGKLAIYTMQKRLLTLRADVGNKGETITAKPFTLYNAGLYDFARVRELPWADYRLFALQLFQIRDEPHKVAGIQVDGYKGVSDALVFNFKAKEGVQLDEEYIADLHRHLGPKARSEFFIVAPAACVTFLEDYIDRGGTRYYVLRIPYSIIDELHDRPFHEIRQPIDESRVNDIVDAVGFDFIQTPTLRARYYLEKVKGELFGRAIIKIDRFESHAMTKNPREYKNRETLSMVMVDYDYKANGEEIFSLNAVFFRNQLEEQEWEVHLDPQLLHKKIMIIYIDIFGNDLREVKTPPDFGIQDKSNAKREKTKKVARP